MFGALKEIWASLEVKERTYLKSGLQFILLFGGLSIFALPFILTRNSYWEWMDFSKTGEIGDTINGISTPFITLLGAILTFLAFYIQFKANTQQRDQFVQQLEIQQREMQREIENQRNEKQENEKKQQLERFETKYYELLRFHRANVDEMNIAYKIYGRKCFVEYYYEFKYIYEIVENVWLNDPNYNARYTLTEITDLAYKLFFYGVGDLSDKATQYLIGAKYFTILTNSQSKLTKVQERYSKHLADQIRMGKELLFEEKYPNDKLQFEPRYYPFDGHSAKLGHYYRHLFQTVKFIANANILEREQKYEYLRTLRAQLSNHEQLMLYYNSISEIGKKWNTEKYLTEFRLIHNMPVGFADFGITPHDKYKVEIEEMKAQGIHMFEWDENIE